MFPLKGLLLYRLLNHCYTSNDNLYASKGKELLKIRHQELIKYSVEHNKITILDKLLNYDQSIMKSIISIYSLINVSPKIPMNGLKLMNIIKKSSTTL